MTPPQLHPVFSIHGFEQMIDQCRLEWDPLALTRDLENPDIVCGRLVLRINLVLNAPQEGFVDQLRLPG